MPLPHHEVYAIRYATVDRQRHENFVVSPDLHESAMPLDYFVWVIRHEQRVWLVDTGFGREAALARKRQFLRCPIASLEHLGIAAADVRDVIITHLHYDHAGNVSLLKDARIHVQEREVHFATGCQMCRPYLRLPYAVDDVVEIVRRVYADRVVFHRGDSILAPGLELFWVGGHTDGLQCVRVHTARGWVVLASDAVHFYDNIERETPYSIVFHVGDMLAGWEKVKQSADSADHIVPGHDPLVMARYPRAGSAGTEIVALHLSPNLT